MTIFSLTIIKISGSLLYWFGLSFILKIKLSSGYFGLYGIKLSKYLDNLTFLQLFIILFTIFYLSPIFIKFVLLYLLDINLIHTIIPDFSLMVESNSTSTVESNPTSTGSTSIPKANPISKVGDADNALIMATAVSGGTKLALQQPTLAGKTVAVVGGITSGVSAIILKEIAGTVGDEITKNNKSTFLGGNKLEKILKTILGLGDNDVMNFLQIIDLLHYMQFLFLISLIINFIIYGLDLVIIEAKLNNYISNKTIILYIVKYLKYIKKSSYVMIICLLLLLIVTTFLTTHYYHFFFINFDKICKIIIKI